MGYYNHNNSSTEQVGYNLLGQRTQQLSNLNNRASNSFLNGKLDDYFYTLIALRQNLTPNLTAKERQILNKIEKDIHVLKSKAMLQKKEQEHDEPGYAIISRFKKFNKFPIEQNLMSSYVEKIKKFEQLLLLVMKKKGFYPGKSDASSVS